MRCYSCDYEFDNETGVCPNCGTDNRLYRAILSSSARCYNEGLELAKVRNLTGAANKLTAALRFDKMNTDARFPEDRLAQSMARTKAGSSPMMSVKWYFLGPEGLGGLPFSGRRFPRVSAEMLS